ncbi:MAG: hypothetical protein ACRCYC_06040 [Paraclostridium sp.]|uniref:hypothetical protein n=1 Tax=Paraclostridium sp. TaxID=2023273 RepID=UPI003F35ED8F
MFKFIKICLISLIIFFISSVNINSFNYYDLYFEKTSDTIVKGELESLQNGITYKTIYNLNLSKDEIDAINHCVKINFREYKKINEEKINENVRIRPVYRKIEGNIVKDYKSWNQKKKIIIKVPIDIDYIIKNH